MVDSKYIKVSCRNLLLGMYVAELDRPWVRTPFPVDGFPIRTVDELKDLSKYCKYIYLDPKRGKVPVKTKTKLMTILSSARKKSPAAVSLKIRQRAYKKTTPLRKEINTVKLLYEEITIEFTQLQLNIKAGKPITLNFLTTTVEKFIQSIIRNPDAFVWHLVAGKRDPFPLSQCVSAAIWATVFARHLGYTESEMGTLFMGTLLADIGMNKLPKNLVVKSGPFRRKEYLAYRKHIHLGLELVKGIAGLDKGVISIIKYHHERHDGLGFPGKLKGDQIPVLARIANIAYSFEKLLHKKDNLKAMSPAAAIGNLYKHRKIKFQDQLVCEFIKAIGTYPTGSVVELSNQEIGIVVEQDAEQRLAPKIILVTDKDKRKLKKNPTLNLKDYINNVTHIGISKGLNAGSYGIYPQEFNDIVFEKKRRFGFPGFR